MKHITIKECQLGRKRDERTVADSISVMRKQEETTYKVNDCLQTNNISSSIFSKKGRPVDEKCRSKMCEWGYKVVDYCGFKRETVAIAMNYLDRFVTAKPTFLQSLKEYQLASMTCLYVAIKLFEPVQMDIKLLADMSRGCYKEQEIIDMEQQILLALQFRVNAPTVLSFVQHFLELLPESVETPVAGAILEHATFQTELAAGDYDLVRENPSDVALAAILNSFEGLGHHDLSFKTRRDFIDTVEFYSGGVTCEQVEAVRQYLEHLLLQKYKTGLQQMMEPRVDALRSEASGRRFSMKKRDWASRRSTSFKEASPVCISKHS